MGDFIIAIFITLVTVMIPVINNSSGVDTTFFGFFLSKTAALYYYICGITDLSFVEINIEAVEP